MSPISQLCKLKHRNLIDSAKVKIVGGLKKQFSILLSPFLPDHMQQQSNSTFWLSVSFLQSTGKEKHFKNKMWVWKIFLIQTARMALTWTPAWGKGKTCLCTLHFGLSWERLKLSFPYLFPRDEKGKATSWKHKQSCNKIFAVHQTLALNWQCFQDTRYIQIRLCCINHICTQ